MAIKALAPERAWDEEPTVADGEVHRILTVGDIHGSGDVLRAALDYAEMLLCDAIVQVGDFWICDDAWEPYRRYAQGADLMHVATTSRLPIVVVDGNHEVWPTLDRFRSRPEVVSEAKVGRPLNLGGNLWWADRGSTWPWGGRRVGALGGAVSPDTHLYSARERGSYRWPEWEAPEPGDLARLLANASKGIWGTRLDVLFTHDAPRGVTGLVSGLSYGVPPEIEARADDVRGLLREAVDRTEPRLVVHGHWHHAYQDRFVRKQAHRHNVTDVYGLAHDGSKGSFALVDLARLVCEPLGVPAAWDPRNWE